MWLKLTNFSFFIYFHVLQVVEQSRESYRTNIVFVFSEFTCSGAELFGRPSPSLRTSLKSADSDFENPSDSDSDSACLFVYAFIL
jgi:hypothetical protein